MSKSSPQVAAGERSRQRIIGAAAIAFRRHGIDGIGVREVMKLAGLTPGSFYFHFRDKDDLFTEASRQAFASTTEGFFAAIEAIPAGQRLASLIDRYLSVEHRDSIEAGCAMAALGADAARKNLRVRRQFGDAAEQMVERVASCFADPDSAARRRRARVLMASMAGVLMASRLAPDRASADALLADARDMFKSQHARR